MLCNISPCRPCSRYVRNAGPWLPGLEGSNRPLSEQVLLEQSRQLGSVAGQGEDVQIKHLLFVTQAAFEGQGAKDGPAARPRPRGPSPPRGALPCFTAQANHTSPLKHHASSVKHQFHRPTSRARRLYIGNAGLRSHHSATPTS